MDMHLRSRTAPDPESPDDGDGDSTVLLHERSRSSARSAEQPRSCWAIGMCVMALAAAGLLAHSVLREWTDAGELRVVTWNIAAINNNPFEYWITHDDADYNKLMEDVQDFISSPGERDVEVGSVFSASMWAELKALMVARGWEGVEQVDERWRTDFSRRKIISGFMKDKVSTQPGPSVHRDRCSFAAAARGRSEGALRGRCDSVALRCDARRLRQCRA